MTYSGKLLLILFIIISSFGVFGMHPAMSNHSGGCIAATIQDTKCPAETNSFDYLSFHLNAYKEYSTAIFGNNLVSILLLTFSIFVFAGFLIFNSSKIYLFQLFFHKYRSKKIIYSKKVQKVKRWLTLLENIPSFSF